MSVCLLLLLLLLVAAAYAQTKCEDLCLLGSCLANNTCAFVPLNTCIRINIDTKVPFSDSLPLNQREGPSTSAKVVGVWSANDRPVVVAQIVYSDFRSWFKLKLGNNAPVWSAYGMTRNTQWFSACSQPTTSRPPATTTTTTTTTAPPVVTSQWPQQSTVEPTQITRTQCSDAFSCETCVQHGCQFCYDSAAFTIAVPGICSANCSLVTPRSAEAPIVSLEQPAHCASLDDFIKSKEEEANTGTGQTDTTVLHFCLLPGTTCPRCVNRIGCYWCSTGYCIHDPAMCDVPLLLQSETACPERMMTEFNGNTEEASLTTTAKTGTGLADLLDIESIETWQIGLAVGGALLVCLLLMSLIFVCYLRHLKKKQLPNLSARTKESTVQIFSDDTSFPSATFGNSSGASFGHHSGTSFGSFGSSTVRGNTQQQQESYGQGGSYGQGTTYGNPYY